MIFLLNEKEKNDHILSFTVLILKKTHTGWWNKLYYQILSEIYVSLFSGEQPDSERHAVGGEVYFYRGSKGWIHEQHRDVNKEWKFVNKWHNTHQVWSKSAQAVGTMRVRATPQARVWKGALSRGLLRSHLCFSSLSITTGSSVIPGAAIKIRLKTTCEIPFPAAAWES